MITKVIMPKLGETMEEGTLGKWLKKEGDRVTKGDPLFEVTTDKANFEVEAPGGGVVRKLLAREGETVGVTETVAWIADALDEEIPATPERKEVLPGSVAVESGSGAAGAAPAAAVNASPLAKKLARERGIDVNRVKGTGPGGRVLEKDVLDYQPAPAEPAGFTVVQLTGIRKIAAGRLARSKQEAPHFYVSAEIDMTSAARLRESLLGKVEREHGVRLSLNDFLIYAVSRTLMEFPLLNAHFVDGAIRQFHHVNLGVAVSIADGLVVPVVKNADTKTLSAIAKEIVELVRKAREGKLGPGEMTGGTFTVSNLGMLKVDAFAAILNPPEVGILAAGEIKSVPVVMDGGIVPRMMMKVTVSADHRAVDGAYAARFLGRLRETLEKPSFEA